MQREDSLGETTTTPRLSTVSTQRFKSWSSESSISSISGVFACEATSEGHSDLSVSGKKLRSEKILDGDEGRNAEGGLANMTPTEHFEEGEQTLIRPEHHQEDPHEPGEDLEQERVEKPRRTSEHSQADAWEELLFKSTSKPGTKSNNRRKEQSSLVKQGKNAMMSSNSLREEQ